MPPMSSTVVTLPARLVLNRVTKTYATRRRAELVALDGIDLVVESGESVAIVGTSGCGKSTLLRIVAGINADGFQRGVAMVTRRRARGDQRPAGTTPPGSADIHQA